MSRPRGIRRRAVPSVVISPVALSGASPRVSSSAVLFAVMFLTAASAASALSATVPTAASLVDVSGRAAAPAVPTAPIASGALAESAAAGTVSNGTVDLAALRARARALALADESAWWRLLHYHPTASASAHPLSHVDDARFFLAGAVGRHDPAAELDATIVRLFATDGPGGAVPAHPGEGAGVEGAGSGRRAESPDEAWGGRHEARRGESSDDDPRCRFVAREAWLRERLAPLALPARTRCEGFARWRDTLNAHSITLIFPAAYLNNPSSMFGHTLLRLDPPDIASGSNWLSWSLNFAADVGTDTSRTATYAWKGITGGYPGRFQLEPYFRKLRQYGAIENRDIWEYRLDLTPAEVGRLVEHVWELRDIAFDYFFFRENCSYRLLELLDHARPSLALAAAFRFTAIPADTVRAVASAGIVEQAVWLPSTASLLRHESAAVPTHARDWIEVLAHDPSRASGTGFARLELAVQRDVVLAANRLMTYRARRAPASEAAARRRLAMLALLSGYPARVAAVPIAPARPERGHDTTLASLGIGHEEGRGHVELGLRASYHDLLDALPGYLPGAAISLGELRLRADAQERLRLESVDLIGIRSLGAPVPFLPTPSWGVDVGLVRDPSVEAGRLGFRARGLVGLSRSPGEGGGMLLYALVGPSLQLYAHADEAHGRARTNAHVRLGALVHGRHGSSRLELGMDSLQGHAPRLSAEIAHDLPLSRNRALRARAGLSRLGEERLRRVSLDYRVHF